MKYLWFWKWWKIIQQIIFYHYLADKLCTTNDATILQPVQKFFDHTSYNGNNSNSNKKNWTKQKDECISLFYTNVYIVLRAASHHVITRSNVNVLHNSINSISLTLWRWRLWVTLGYWHFSQNNSKDLTITQYYHTNLGSSFRAIIVYTVLYIARNHNRNFQY
jgi:hypothetical protein